MDQEPRAGVVLEALIRVHDRLIAKSDTGPRFLRPLAFIAMVPIHAVGLVLAGFADRKRT